MHICGYKTHTCVFLVLYLSIFWVLIVVALWLLLLLPLLKGWKEEFVSIWRGCTLCDRWWRQALTDRTAPSFHPLVTPDATFWSNPQTNVLSAWHKDGRERNASFGVTSLLGERIIGDVDSEVSICYTTLVLNCWSYLDRPSIGRCSCVRRTGLSLETYKENTNVCESLRCLIEVLVSCLKHILVLQACWTRS